MKEKLRKDERRIVARDRQKIKKDKKIDQPGMKEEVRFFTKKEGVPLRVTKVKFKSQEDIEKELENLAKDFTGRKD